MVGHCGAAPPPTARGPHAVPGAAPAPGAIGWLAAVQQRLVAGQLVQQRVTGPAVVGVEH